MLNLFKTILKFQNYPIKSALVELNKIQSLNAEKFSEWQNSQKWEIVNFHIKNNEFYANKLKNQGVEKVDRWESIPPMFKHDFQKPIKEILTKGYEPSKVYINNTSGSSGHPFFFAKDKFSHALSWVINFQRYKDLGIEYGISMQARFYGIPLSGKKYVFEKLKDLISARIRFPVFQLDDKAFKKFVVLFSKKKFEYVNGYTSVLVAFAIYLKRNNIVLKEICPSLKVVIPTSEMLFDSDRTLIQETFGVQVFNEYGASEVGIIAIENNRFEWVISNESLFVEIVDENYKTVSGNQKGRILVTSLFNRAFPFIRYEIGDIGAIDNSLRITNQILKELQGRTNDLIQLPSGKNAPGLTFYYISKALLEEGACIQEFIIRQLELNLFHFEYVATDEMTEEVKDKIRNAMSTYLEKGLFASFERRQFIERSNSGKLKHFQGLKKTII